LTDIQISGRDQLVAALANARGGETFVLGAGNYGRLVLNGSQFAAPVTIRSANANAMAKFAGIEIYNTANLTFKSVDIGRPLAAGEADWTQMGFITGSRNITLDSVKIHGSLDGNPKNDGWGLLVQSTQGLTVSNSDFTELNRGMIVERSSDIKFLNNTVHHLRSDGTNFTASDRVTVENNRFWAFSPNPGDHPDAIQFWTTGQTRGSTDIVIRGNQVFQNTGVGTQGIFIRDENGNMPHRNIVIENNILYGADQWHGISVEGAVGLRITNNTVVSPTTDARNYWIKVDKASNVQINRNVSDDMLIGAVSNFTQSENIIFKTDPGKLGLIPNINAGAAARPEDLAIAYYGYQIGAGAIAPPPPPPTPVPPPSIKAPRGAIIDPSAFEAPLTSAGATPVSDVADADVTRGRGTIDRLSGTDGPDIFVLGDQRGVFYDDGIASRSGRGDYGQILDFQLNVDQIQLAGTRADYVFKTTTVNGLGGLGIFVDTNQNGGFDSRDELIGHVAGVRAVSPEHFVFA
jgi:hypothetical protein